MPEVWSARTSFEVKYEGSYSSAESAGHDHLEADCLAY
jgi:hypothetical protein